MAHILRISRTVNQGARERPIHTQENTLYVVRDGNEELFPVTEIHVCMYDLKDILPGQNAAELLPGHFVCGSHLPRVPLANEAYGKFGKNYSVTRLPGDQSENSDGRVPVDVSVWLNFRLPRNVK